MSALPFARISLAALGTLALLSACGKGERPVTELAAEPTNETPSAASGLQPATTRTPAPSARKTAPAPVPAPTPTATATPAADPHAGHDMSTMSDEDMKAMGHN